MPKGISHDVIEAHISLIMYYKIMQYQGFQILYAFMKLMMTESLETSLLAAESQCILLAGH